MGLNNIMKGLNITYRKEVQVWALTIQCLEVRMKMKDRQRVLKRAACKVERKQFIGVQRRVINQLWLF